MNYAEIKYMDVANGEGIRTSLFVSGCQFHCPDCFNQEAQCYKYGQEYTEQTEKEILAEIDKPYIKGLSILGGDPLWQSYHDILTLAKLVYEVKKLGKTVWLWSGFTWEELYKENYNADDIFFARQTLVELCDVFVDGRFEKDKKDLSLHWRGSSNQRVIDVKESKRLHRVVLYEE